MTTVVQYSTSINNAFISTVDHLPCDVVRSLWLVQNCNITIDKLRRELHALLLRVPGEAALAAKVLETKSRLQFFQSEAVEETRNMYNQLQSHRLSLHYGIRTLKRMVSGVEQTSNSQLEQQLKKHYAQHPLPSQKEALQEQKLKKTAMIHPPKTGLKLVLKLPGRPKGKKKPHKVKKPIKVKPAPIARVPEPEPVPLPPLPVVEEDNNLYCFCNQPSFGDMIGCDNDKHCPNGDWFHYKCVGLLNRVEALKYTTGQQKWFCSAHCRDVVAQKEKKPKLKKKRSKW